MGDVGFAVLPQQLLKFSFALGFRQVLPLTQFVHLVPHTGRTVLIAQGPLQSPPPLDIFRMVDDIAHRFYVTVPAFQHVVVCAVAGALQRVPAPLAAGLEQMGQSGDIRRQLRHFYAKTHASCHGLYYCIRAVAGEVREVALAVVHRSEAVQHTGLVPHSKDLVVDASEFRHSLADVLLIQVWVLLPKFGQQRLGFFVGHATPGLALR